MRFFRGKIERPPVIIRRGRSYHPRDSTHQKIVIFQATTHNKALVTWKLLSPRGTKCHDFMQLLYQKHSWLGAGTYRNFFELTCKTETTIKSIKCNVSCFCFGLFVWKRILNLYTKGKQYTALQSIMNAKLSKQKGSGY